MEIKDIKIFKVGNIGNMYGYLEIKEENGKYFWTITGYGGDEWEEIPEKLFNELLTQTIINS